MVTKKKKVWKPFFVSVNGFNPGKTILNEKKLKEFRAEVRKLPDDPTPSAFESLQCYQDNPDDFVSVRVYYVCSRDDGLRYSEAFWGSTGILVTSGEAEKIEVK